MRNTILRSIAILGVLAGSAFAQDRATAYTNVPFAFHAGATVLPAGEYTISQNAASGIVRLVSRENGAEVAVLSNSAERGARDLDGKLIFRSYGDNHFLWQIWAPGQDMGRALNTSPQEREMAQDSRVQLASVPTMVR